MSGAGSLEVRSEIGRLRSVVLHLPGDEIDRMLPSMMIDLLFEDILFGDRAREEHRRERLAHHRRRYLDKPVLRLPLRKVRVSFNPNTLQPFDGHGTVYPTMRASDVWGILEVTDGALMDPGWSQITVPAPGDPDARPLAGEGWTLDLAEGVELVLDERPGDLTLKLP